MIIKKKKKNSWPSFNSLNAIMGIYNCYEKKITYYANSINWLYYEISLICFYFLILTGVGKIVNNSFGQVNNHKGQFEKSMPNVLKDEMHETISDISEEDSFSLCVPKYKTRKVQKVKIGKSRKNIFGETNMSEYVEAKQQIEKYKHLFVSELEPNDNNPLDTRVTIQKTSGIGSDRMSKETVLSSDSQKTRPTLLSCGQNNSVKDLIDTEKECTSFITVENLLPEISNMSKAEMIVHEDTMVNKRDEGHSLTSHEDSISVIKPTIYETSLVGTSQEGIKRSILGIRESAEETLSSIFSNNVTNPNFKEKNKGSEREIEINTICLQEEESLCSSVDNGSQPTNIRHTSAALKSAGLISTLKKKKRKFIYTINDEKTDQGEKLLKGQASQLSVQFGANTFEAPLEVTNTDSGMSFVRDRVRVIVEYIVL